MDRHTVRSWHDGSHRGGNSTQTASDITLSRLTRGWAPLSPTANFVLEGERRIVVPLTTGPYRQASIGPPTYRPLVDHLIQLYQGTETRRIESPALEDIVDTTSLQDRYFALYAMAWWTKLLVHRYGNSNTIWASSSDVDHGERRTWDLMSGPLTATGATLSLHTPLSSFRCTRNSDRLEPSTLHLRCLRTGKLDRIRGEGYDRPPKSLSDRLIRHPEFLR
jgi:hypothetical protein